MSWNNCRYNPFALDFAQYMGNLHYRDSFFFSPTTALEVKQTIFGLKNKRCNINECPIHILKFAANVIAPVLTHLINRSFEGGNFLDGLKIVRVVRIFKEGETFKIENYRPISILFVFRKMFEKLAHKRLYDYCDHNPILNESQYEFRQNKNTTQAIINHYNIFTPLSMQIM